MTRRRVVVESIQVHNNGEPFGKGELYWNISANGRIITERHASGALSVSDGEVIPLNEELIVRIPPNGQLVISGSVSDRDRNTRDESANFQRTYSNNDNWGLGGYDVRLVDGPLDVTLHYRILSLPVIPSGNPPQPNQPQPTPPILLAYTETPDGAFSYPDQSNIRDANGELHHPEISGNTWIFSDTNRVVLMPPQGGDCGDDRNDTRLFLDAIAQMKAVLASADDVTLVIPRNFACRPRGSELPDTSARQALPADYIIRHPFLRDTMTATEFAAEIAPWPELGELYRGILRFGGDNSNKIDKPLRIIGKDPSDPPVIRVSPLEQHYVHIVDNDGNPVLKPDGTEDIKKIGPAIEFENITELVVSDLVIDGNRSRRGLAMRPDPALFPATENGGMEHNIRIRGCKNYKFSHVQSLNAVSGGIGVEVIAPRNDERLWQNGIFENCRVLNSAYLGLSISEGRRIRIIGGEYSYTNALSTMAGISIEGAAQKPDLSNEFNSDAELSLPVIADILIQGVRLEGNWKDVHLNGRWNNGWVTVKNCIFVRRPALSRYPMFGCVGSTCELAPVASLSVNWSYGVISMAKWVSVHHNTFDNFFRADQSTANSAVIRLYNHSSIAPENVPPAIDPMALDPIGGHEWVGDNVFTDFANRHIPLPVIRIDLKSGVDVCVVHNHLYQSPRVLVAGCFISNKNPQAYIVRGTITAPDMAIGVVGETQISPLCT
ncbi:MAG: hypothetical protein IPM27_10680 [Nitrosomonadales bacterium]|nr:hypothetical protein [Nitrosomonadales bacterium]